MQKNTYIKREFSKVFGVFSLIIIASITLVNAQTTVQSTSTSSCPVVTKFMKLGENNDKSEVSKLQSFLKNTEKLNVEITGEFDVKTESAVKEFQKKYADIILAPWKATLPSGVVYLTTMKKINNIACGIPMTLDPTELDVIISYKVKSSDLTIIENRSSIAIGADNAVGEIENDNVAAVGSVSIAQKFVSFLKGLFK